jgi:hypothetical protein
VDSFDDLKIENNVDGNAVVSWGNESVTLVGVDAANVSQADIEFQP